MVCRGVHASHSKSLQHRNKGQQSSFIPFPCRATDTHDSSTVQTSTVPAARLESLCPSTSAYHFLSILEIRILELNFKHSHVWRSDSTKLILTWEAVKVMITWLSFSCHGFISTVGALTAAFFYGKKADADRKFHAAVFILETTLFQGKISLKHQEFEL